MDWDIWCIVMTAIKELKLNLVLHLWYTAADESISYISENVNAKWDEHMERNPKKEKLLHSI